MGRRNLGRGKGAWVTGLGLSILFHYRSLQSQIDSAATCPDREALAKAMLAAPRLS